MTTTTTPIAAALARMVPNSPTAGDLERLRLEAEATRTAANQAADRVKRLQAEIAAAKSTAQPQPELAQIMAALTAAEIEARVRAVPLPKGHAERVAESRAAIAAAEAKRAEAEVVLPALESLRQEIDADARRARDMANHASATYGSALMLHTAATRYLPALAAALAVEAEISQIEDTWGGNVSFEIQFRNPSTGDRWTRNELERVVEKESAAKVVPVTEAEAVR